ncbi:glycosyltransferase family A protein [Microbacterium yannicii]|uniref:glycosyltransferase family A protein n=1 Tax=Microbacterium yannicii TaxID=671622 RepID=UPI0003038796|nr:glycosyltransferase family A protein [Microbacterium yannicii]
MGRNGPPSSTVDGAAVSDSTRFDEPSPTPPLRASAHGAVVIPARDEAGVIARTLRSLIPLTALEGIEIIVACNGCSDGTAAIAAGFEGVRVAQTDTASKAAGLNLGDRVATSWPRLYLDADIEIAPSAVLAVFDALDEPGVLAARPYYAYDTTGATVPVRAYYRARSRASAPATRLWGAGGYAVSEQGHARFAEFPRVTADDSWFDEQFRDHEKRVVPTAPMRVRTPRDTRALMAVLRRQRRGHRELGIPSHATSRTRSIISAIRGPRSAADAGWYILLSLAARRRVRPASRSAAEHPWERDASSRTDAATQR